jgi:hypothetical protein
MERNGDDIMTGVDAKTYPSPESKAQGLQDAGLRCLSQERQKRNPGARITLDELGAEGLLSDFATAYEGMSRGDSYRFDRKFWELPWVSIEWSRLLNSPEKSLPYSGREHITYWQRGTGELAHSSQARIVGRAAWGKSGIFVARTSDLRCTLSTGDLHAQNGAVIVPRSLDHLAAIWLACCSSEYRDNVKELNDKIIVARRKWNA